MARKKTGKTDPAKSAKADQPSVRDSESQPSPLRCLGSLILVTERPQGSDVFVVAWARCLLF